MYYVFVVLVGKGGNLINDSLTVTEGDIGVYGIAALSFFSCGISVT